MERYPNIADHGLIGDLQTAALVTDTGTIDWFCTPRFDSPSVFAPLLDADKRGHFQIAPSTPVLREQQIYFPGSACLITRFITDHGVAEAVELARALGMTPLRISAQRKPLLHAGAALASNALVGLLAVAAEAAAGPMATADERNAALRDLLPLAEGTLRNVAAVGIPQALTGAVERGDVGTVQIHLEALSGLPAEVYAAFLPVLLRLAAEKGSEGALHAEEILQLLAEVSTR